MWRREIETDREGERQKIERTKPREMENPKERDKEERKSLSLKERDRARVSELRKNPRIDPLSTPRYDYLSYESLSIRPLPLSCTSRYVKGKDM